MWVNVYCIVVAALRPGKAIGSAAKTGIPLASVIGLSPLFSPMAENENGAERTEQPTAKRLDDARKDGNLPRSRELGAAAVFAGGVVVLVAAGGGMARGALGWMRAALSPERALYDSPALLFGHWGHLLLRLMWVIVPLIAVCLVICALAPALMGGLKVSSKALMPDFKRMNPLSGIKRLYGPEALAELAKSLLRVGFVGSAAGLCLWQGVHELLPLIHQPLEHAVKDALGFALKLLISTAAALALLAAIDAPYQKWSWRRKLKMTRQEVRDELKQTEGKPEVKGRIRQIMQQMAQRRMMEDVPGADVVVVNPTHYAVALKYDGDSMRAPKVVAKGADEIAARIRAMAEQHKVAILSAPPLARVLYREAKIGQEIPVRLYAAVAQVLSWVYQLRAWKQGAGGSLPQTPSIDINEHEPAGERP